MKKIFSIVYILVAFLMLDRLLAFEVPDHYRSTADFERFHTEAFSQKMKSLAQFGAGVELIVLGDSRARHGVDPAFFSSQAADRAVTVYNLAPASGGIRFTRLLLEENLDRLPRLRTVVWGVSPRIFSAYWRDPIAELYVDSDGYRFDRLEAAAAASDMSGLRTTGGIVFERLFSEISQVFKHRSILKSMALDRIAPREVPRFAGDDPARLTRWGYLPMPHRSYVDTGGVEELAKYKRDHRRGAFRLDAQRFDDFVALIEELGQRDIRLVVFVPPMHPSLREVPVADHDGTPDADYAALMKRLKALEKNHANYHFRDFHLAGRNDFRDAHWANFDHLTPGGAEVFTGRLQTWLGRLNVLPAAAPKIDGPRAGRAANGLARWLATGKELLSHVEFWSALEAAPKDAKPPRAKHNRDGDYSIVDMVREPYPLFRVTYDDPESGIDTDSVRIYLNDEDVTARAQVTAGAVSYKPKQKLETGLYSVRVVVKDKAGNKTEIVWDIMYQQC